MSNRHFEWISRRRSLLGTTSWLCCERQEDKVLKLKKALYGLKQAPRMWNRRINKYFLDNGYLRCPYEHSLFIKVNGHGDILVVCLYVDDLIFTGNCASMFEDLKNAMTQEFEMIYIGLDVILS